ncbi:MAG TPA: hypothetical protein VFZ84_08265 [Burkholderiales bacterium]
MTPLALGYSGCMLLAAGLVCLSVRRWSLNLRARIGLALAAAVSVMLPMGDLFAADYIRAVFGDLSVLSQAMLAAFILGYVADRRLLDLRQLRAVMAAAFAGGLFLYPAALGLVPVDPYSLGFGSVYFAGALGGLTLIAWYLGFHWLAGGMLLAVSARLLDALESRNLWDYLLDPLLVLYAALWLGATALRRGYSFSR